MKNFTVILIMISATILFGFAGVKNTCITTRELGTSFEAMKKIDKVEFNFVQNLELLNPFGIQEATFYSCDGNNGYMVVKTSRRDYIHENVPRYVWEDFKNSYSLNRFYDRYIKNNTLYIYS